MSSWLASFGQSFFGRDLGPVDVDCVCRRGFDRAVVESLRVRGVIRQLNCVAIPISGLGIAGLTRPVIHSATLRLGELVVLGSPWSVNGLGILGMESTLGRVHPQIQPPGKVAMSHEEISEPLTAATSRDAAAVNMHGGPHGYPLS